MQNIQNRTKVKNPPDFHKSGGRLDARGKAQKNKTITNFYPCSSIAYRHPLQIFDILPRLKAVGFLDTDARIPFALVMGVCQEEKSIRQSLQYSHEIPYYKSSCPP